MTTQEIFDLFSSLWSDINHAENFPATRPFLAHYTSIANLEAIMRGDEIWLSNPLFMNDTEEVRFGINEGMKAFYNSQEIRDACETEERYRILTGCFQHYYNAYDNEHVFDTYVLSLSKHDVNHTDGQLSMWRAYGGNGHGAAIIFDSNAIEFKEQGSPLIISRVEYLKPAERREWIANKMTEFANLLQRNAVPDSQLSVPVHQLFERIKIAAIFTKHDGFKEEAEWRVAYLKERDPEGVFTSMMGYGIGRHGVEPKLKFKVRPLDGMTAPDLSLEKLIHQIILGPMISGVLAKQSVRRMLQTIRGSELAGKVEVSTIPYRPS